MLRKLHQGDRQNKVGSSCEPFVIPDLPGNIVITKEQIADVTKKARCGNLM
ncbi:unnamed protein product [Arabidopsis lyrata]|nr:unnamed protein product [Arabidopsis lyrata]